MSKKNKKTTSISNNHQFIRQSILEMIGQNSSLVLTYKNVAKRLNFKDSNSKKSIHFVLNELAKEGKLKEFVRGQFSLPKKSNTDGKKRLNPLNSLEQQEGIIEFTRHGAAFIVVDGEEKDIYIPQKHTLFALDGDKVKVAITKKGSGRPEGKVIEIIERSKSYFVGVLQANNKTAFVLPDNQKIQVDFFIPPYALNGARSGEKVLIKFIEWKEKDKSPSAEIVEIIGLPGSNDAEMISILVENGIDYTFSQKIIREAEQIGLALNENEVQQRRDFRNVLTFTIDPKDAKDFDDALSLQQLPNGNYEIGVHIADVSHYVTMGSAMDIEAQKRGNSVYLVDRVVPMLPEQLSNLACSLRPNEDKYSFSAVFEIDKEGNIKNEWYGKTVIHSNRRFTYEEAQEIIEGKEDELSKAILYLDQLAKKYREKRLKAGALNIESEEVRFQLNELGQPDAIIIKVSKDAHKLIEEFMLLANKSVAKYLAKANPKDTLPIIYRVHDAPDIGKIETFKLFIENFGYAIDYKSERDISKSINQLLSDIRYKNEHSIIQTMAIRSMAKASYEINNIGHYGLAFEHYVHFTSPIRRYADLLIHRILYAQLNKQKPPYSIQQLSEIAKNVSRTERKAAEAERSSAKYFQVQFVKDRIGEIFTATISGITDFGIFAEMEENKCEGLIPLETIENDRYYFNAQKYAIVGSKQGKTYTLGDKILVKIKEVNVPKRSIDLLLVNND
jgi:ribonuclease R